MGHSDDIRLERLVSELVTTRRRIASLQAQEMRLLSAGLDLALERMDARAPDAGTARDIPLREIAAEFAAAMGMSDRTVQSRMGTAASLVTRFAATLRTWDEGRISSGHVSAILDAGCEIDDDAERARYEEHVLAVAEHESVTRLRTVARAVAATLTPASDETRNRRAQDERVVRVFDMEDGMARLIADGPAPLMHAIFDRLTQMGRLVLAAAVPDEASDAVDRMCPEGTDGDDAEAPAGSVFVTRPTRLPESDAPADGRTPVQDLRTMDQVRTDILTDLLLAGAPAAHGAGDALGAIAGHVQITVPVLTLLGEGSEPALLAGSGPIDPDTARRLTANAPSWTRVLTDPGSGHPLLVDRYRPSRKQRRFLATRDEHCRFPGCRVRVRRCDVDHTIDAAQGGATSTANLAHLCRRHHVLKHHSAWTVRQRPGGVLEWRSPTGRAYSDRAPSSLRFVPSKAGGAAGPSPGRDHTPMTNRTRAEGHGGAHRPSLRSELAPF